MSAHRACEGEAEASRRREREDELVDPTVWTQPMSKRERRARPGTTSMTEEALWEVLLDPTQPDSRRAAAEAEITRRRS